MHIAYAGSGRQLTKDKTLALTRGRGHHHVMVIITYGAWWDLEALVGSDPVASTAKSFAMVLLCLAWTLLLINVSGIKSYTWFLLGVGANGRRQNFYIAGASRSSAAFDIHLATYSP